MRRRRNYNLAPPVSVDAQAQARYKRSQRSRRTAAVPARRPRRITAADTAGTTLSAFVGLDRSTTIWHGLLSAFYRALVDDGAFVFALDAVWTVNDPEGTYH
jgi:hypothetical protein